MSTIVKQIEVKTLNGERIALFRIEETVIAETDKQSSAKPDNGQSRSQIVTAPSKPPAPSGGNGTKPQNGNVKSQSVSGDPMTDSQKRFLFRIMVERGKTGEEAHEHLKGLFKVKSLKDVTKLEASQLIEALLAFSPAQGNGGGDGSSF
ncbi:MAG: hypothetical protein M1378_12160 [Bacteroidetes bacterium]|jgi:hypothetical protein|nr:hypothetical protein [Bacteroidota bacterium]